MAGESNLIRAYGDRRDDGVIQISFTLPVPLSDKAKEAARLFCTRLGLLDVKVAAAEPAADNYTFFVVYARADVSLDYAEIDVPEIIFKKLGFSDLNKLIEDRVSRRVVVLGACTGSDTHTVGIDAILNMKGYSGDYGLERYPWFEAYNLGSQVPNEELIRRAEEKKADAILVSQVVTQRDVHKDNSRQFIEVAKAHGMKGKTILLLGGPRVDHKLAMELGFDAGFGPGTKPSDVANYIVHALLKKMGKEPEDLHFEGEPG
ncbi:MAG TPA: OAM dimerization domain-containing protein [Myxococcaceae bacterium]|jgi:beta-lysine 5,6-aminomutase beta subunit